MTARGKTYSDVRLRSLVPALAVELAATSGNIHRTITGSMLSADISGFTALSERLAGKGKAGAEEITALINECFTALIAAAQHHGGEIIKFGGDAILVLFRSDDHALRAGAAAIDMQTALAGLGAAKRARLSMTVGAATGPFDAYLVGTEHRELLLLGPNASKVIHLEGTAAKGQTLVDDTVAEALRGHADIEPADDGWTAAGQTDLEPVTPPSIANADLAALIPVAVASHFAGFADLGGEHRLVTTGFLSVGGLDQSSIDDPAAAAESLGELVDAVARITREHGVTVLHSDVAPDGAKFVLCAGAPVTLGNTADAMLSTGLAIGRLQTPFELRVGVQFGRVFAGFLGAPDRRTYTLMGDPVNTAARMLGQARPGEVVAVDDVLAATRMVFDGDALPPFAAKGKSEPINATVVYASTEWAQRPRTDAPHVGRTAEREALLAVLHGDVPLIEVVAPAGTGKSRLLDELRFEASRHLHPVVSARCTPYSAATPYALLQSIVRLAADIDHAADPEIAGELLAKAVRHHDPDLLAMLPVLAIPAGADVAETPEASAIDPKFLRERIHEETARFLQAALPSGTMLIVEDMHWVDDASSDFLEFSADHRLAQHWSVVLSSRPNGNWTLDPTNRSTITLEPLSDAEVRTLILESVETELTDRTVETIMARSAGNPLFAIELAKLVGGDGSADALPDTVEQLIATRLDVLDPEARRTLRVASVFGQQFTATDLSAVFDGAAIHLESLTEYLERDGEQLEFVHSLFREVAYEGLPFAQRRRFHERVGTHLETTSADRDGIAGLLAEHFFLARNHQRAWQYGTIAGRAARTQAANAEAAIALGRAVKAGRALRSLDKELLAQAALELAEVEVLLGDFDAARGGYDLARKSTERPHVQAEALGGIGEIGERQGRFDQAKRWYSRAHQTLEEAGSTPDVLRARSKVHFLRAGTLHRQGDPQGCIIEGRKALGDAEDANDVAGMAAALQRLHLATVYMGRPDRIEYGPRALELFESIGQHDRVSSTHNNLGIEHYFAGRWSEAAASYELATEAGVRAGSMVDSMLGQLNSGEILSEQGHWDEALDRLHRARRNWEAGRYPIGLCAAKLYLGTTYDRMGDTENARRNLTEALDDIVSYGFSELEEDARLRLLFFEVDQDLHDADSIVAKWSEDESTSAHRPRLLRITATALIRGGRPSEAAELLAAELPTLTGIERALALRLLAHASRDDADPDWQQESQQILDAFGVVRLEPLPTII